jgi:DnaJ-class molecular chaperone
MEQNLYVTLGVDKTATQDQIKAAYRKLASQHHPDRGGSTTSFQGVQKAYEVLSDPERREQYDATGSHEQAPNLDELAANEMSNLILQVVDLVDPSKTNLVDYMRNSVLYARAKDEAALAQMEQQSSRRENAARRVSKSNDPHTNLLRDCLLANAAQIRNHIANMKMNLQKYDHLLAKIAEYEYKPDPAPSRSTSTSTTYYQI